MIKDYFLEKKAKQKLEEEKQITSRSQAGSVLSNKRTWSN